MVAERATVQPLSRQLHGRTPGNGADGNRRTGHRYLYVWTDRRAKRRGNDPERRRIVHDSAPLCLVLREAGSGDGQLSEPRGLALDSEGDLWVADTGNDRIEEFDPEGEYLAQFGETGEGEGQLSEPRGLALTGSGKVWVADSGGDRVQKWLIPGYTPSASYEWDLLDHLAKVEGPSETTSYAYDGLERLSERKGPEGTQVLHYGDLSDLPTYLANAEGETTTSYVQGAHGLVEQRSGEATTYPLTDAHGDVTAITGPTGGVESRQEYSPWGEQLSGPSLEMGYLGAWERPSDPTSGLIQMGARSYDPALGSFMTEDPVMGHMGIGASVDRYLYVWDNPLNRYDLNGRDVCIFGACQSPRRGARRFAP